VRILRTDPQEPRPGVTLRPSGRRVRLASRKYSRAPSYTPRTQTGLRSLSNRNKAVSRPFKWAGGARTRDLRITELRCPQAPPCSRNGLEDRRYSDRKCFVATGRFRLVPPHSRRINGNSNGYARIAPVRCLDLHVRAGIYAGSARSSRAGDRLFADDRNAGFPRLFGFAACRIGVRRDAESCPSRARTDHEAALAAILESSRSNPAA
jgi:hypothetical protein